MTEGEAIKAGGEIVRAATEGRRAEKADLRRVAAENGDLDAAAKAEAASLFVCELLRFRGTSLLAWLTGTLDRQIIREVEEGLRAKLLEIPEDRQQQPKPNVAVPALEALAYSWDEATLREMYLNLIQRAADTQTADKVHPSFVDIIRHLSAAETPLLDVVLRTGEWAAARIVVRSRRPGEFRRVLPVLLDVVDSDTRRPEAFPRLPSWVVNWQRLGLVELDWTTRKQGQNGADAYAYVTERPEWLALSTPEPGETFPDGTTTEGWAADFDRGTLRATTLGLDFLAVVTSQPKA